MALTLLPIALTIFAYWCYSKFCSTFTFWQKRGVIQCGLIQIVVSAVKRLFHSETEASKVEYTEFSNEKFVGTFSVGKPALLVRDPELIETILVKKFSHMNNRANQSNPNGFYAKHLSNLKGEQWKSMRSKLNPTFSSAKLKGMHSQLIECGNVLLNRLTSYEDGSPLNVRDIIQRYSMDVIASCAFGLNISSINSMNSQFRKIAEDIFAPTATKRIITFLRIKQTLRTLGIDRIFFSGERADKEFFGRVIDHMLEERRKNNVVTPDFLHLMNELMEKDAQKIKENSSNSNELIFDRTALVSNAFLFFSAGLETTTSTVSYATYELALNPEVQNRVYEEVRRILSNHDGLPDYSAIKEMTYLDWVVSETLRKYPILSTLTRMVNNEFSLPDTNVVLPVDTQINIPVYLIQHDSQYYPDPEAFRPERFDPDTTNPPRLGTYLPFGGGPRMCIGARFAKIEAKVLLVLLINNFEFIKCPETKVPLTFSPNNDLLWPVGGVWLALKRRMVK